MKAVPRINMAYLLSIDWKTPEIVIATKLFTKCANIHKYIEAVFRYIAPIINPSKNAFMPCGIFICISAKNKADTTSATVGFILLAIPFSNIPLKITSSYIGAITTPLSINIIGQIANSSNA